MYPLLLRPVIKNYIWGGTRLTEEFGYESEPPAAEAWCLSVRRGDENVVLNGAYAGRPLTSVPWIPEDIPLIKLIDAKEDLSVQVHPSRECAALYPGDAEKTEIWYIIDCAADSKLVLGFNGGFENAVKERERKEGVSPREALCLGFYEAVKRDAVGEICRRVSVRPGDVVFVEPGTIHAITRGIFLAEIQQNSDTTYRVYDYGRRGKDGRPRELHIDRAIEALRLAPEESLPAYDTEEETGFGSVRRFGLGDVRSSVVALSGEYRPEGFYHVVVLEGAAALSGNGESLSVKKGDSVLVPVGYAVTGRASLLLTPLGAHSE